MKKKKTTTVLARRTDAYADFAGDIAALLEEARHQASRSVNAILTATYWEIGRRIVEFEQGGQYKAEYGEEIIDRLSHDLTARFGRGFGRRNLFQMRAFYLAYPEIVQTVSAQFERETESRKPQTPSGKLPSEKYATPLRKSPPASIPQIPSAKFQTASGQSTSEYLAALSQAFPMSWSHYVRLLSVRTPEARVFYETEAVRGGWSLRQLDRQISTQFYERTALSRNKAAMLTKGAKPKPEDLVTVEEEVKDPYVLEFLGLKDEYSERELEEALIRHLESFLLELGNDFTPPSRATRWATC